MHLYVDKKKSFLFLLLVIVFLTSINSQIFIKKKDSFYNLKNIEVSGLNDQLNLEIKKSLYFLKNENIFYIDKLIIKDQIEEYNFIEKYNILKFYPSKIIIKLSQTNILAKTLRNNKMYFIGSNEKFIDINKLNISKDLPTVYGNFTAKKFISFRNIIKTTILNYSDFKEIFFFPSGRIDVKLKNNILIKFPKENIEKVIPLANKIIKSKNFKNNIIDLRVPNQVILSNE